MPMPIIFPFLGGGGPPQDEMDRLELMGAIFFVVAAIGGAGHAAYRWLIPRACKNYRGPIDCGAGDIFLYGFTTFVSILAVLIFFTVLFFAIRKVWRALRGHGQETSRTDK